MKRAPVTEPVDDVRTGAGLPPALLVRLDQAVAGLRQRGARIIGDGVQDGAHGTRVAFVHPKSTRGVLLELVEARPPERGL